jgi:competence protein ComEC
MSKRIEVLKKGYNIGIIKSFFLKYLESNFEDISLNFLKAMIIGEDDGFSDEFKQAIMDNGILHLFAVSGLHIILFVGLITKLLNTFKMREKTITILVCILLFFYLIITNFSASVLRAALMYYLALINKTLKLGFSSLDIISIIFIFLIMGNSYYMYDLGFSLSFVASVMIIIVSPIIRNKNNIYQILLISIYAMIITFPMVININNEINIISPITNVIFIELVEGILLPLSFIVLVVPILDILFRYVITALIS